MHARSEIIEAIEAALKSQVKVLPETDAVQEDDLPCVVVEEREEGNGDFDRILERPATALRRRFRFAVFAFGRNKREREDISEKIEQIVVPTVMAVTSDAHSKGIKCALVGVAFSRTRVGTSMTAFLAGNFYDAEYFTPTYM